MGLKLQIKNDNFVIENIEYPIIETFIDFINSYGNGSLEKFDEILLDFNDTKNLKEYINEINNFSIFYLPLLTPPDNLDGLDIWVENTMEESKYVQDFIDRLKLALDICFNLSSNIYNKYNDLTFNQKYSLCKATGLLVDYTYTSILNYDYPPDISTLFTDDIENNYNIIKKTKEPPIIDYIKFSDVNSMCLFAFSKMLKLHTIIKNCKNCGRLFIADNKKEYCNRTLETGLTCYQTYTANNFKERKQNDPILREYMNAYRRVQNFYYKNKNLISTEVKDKIFSNLRIDYDKINLNPSSYNYKQIFNEYNYNTLKEKYL